jgi:hypothetical protein
VPLAAVLALCATAGEARAQSGSGSITVGATILATPPGALSAPLDVELGADGRDLYLRGAPASVAMPTTIFLRVQLTSSSQADLRYIGHRLTADADVRVRLPDAARDSGVHLERLILAGT